MIVSEDLRKAVRNGIEEELSRKWHDPVYDFKYETTYWYEIFGTYEVICKQDTEIIYDENCMGWDFAIPHTYTVKIARTFNCPFAKMTFDNVDHGDLKKKACAWLAETIENDIRNDYE